MVIDNEEERLATNILTVSSSSDESLSDKSDIGKVSVLDLITGSYQPHNTYKKDDKRTRPLTRELAFDTTQIANKGPIPELPPVLEPPYAGTKAMLTLGKAWIALQ